MQKAYLSINRIIEMFLALIFGLLVLDVSWQVFSRYLIGQSSSFTEEFARFALIWLSILGAAYLNGQRGHLSIDFLIRKLPPEQKRRRLVALEILMLLFALFIMVIGGSNLVYITLSLGQKSSALGVPLGVVYSIVPFSGLLIIFYCIHNILHPGEALD
ncbi:MAG: TRAP transporter small permease [Phaeodactylibacter sp.]|nr:TRAP transporter small permease [Phaeodactylibacter sp.]MCB9052568.1 TRAP transporter small permease [Lewinellaceae bacterium]